MGMSRRNHPAPSRGVLASHNWNNCHAVPNVILSDFVPGDNPLYINHILLPGGPTRGAEPASGSVLSTVQQLRDFPWWHLRPHPKIGSLRFYKACRLWGYGHEMVGSVKSKSGRNMVGRLILHALPGGRPLQEWGLERSRCSTFHLNAGRWADPR